MRYFCRRTRKSLVLAITPVALALCPAGARGQVTHINLPPLNGFQPLVIVGLTDEQYAGSPGDVEGFFSHASSTPGGNGVPSQTLPVGGPQHYFVAVIDTGAQANILSFDTATQADFGSADRLGANSLQIVGASGSEFAEITDPVGLYMTDLNRGVGGSALSVLPGTTYRGMYNTSLLTAESGSVLPNIIGAPVVGLYQVQIKNSQPTHVTVGATTYKSPLVNLAPVNTAVPANYSKIALTLTNAVGGPPLFFPGNFENLQDDPAAPTIWESVFANVNITHTAGSTTSSFMFDTGAQVSVLSDDTAGVVGIYTGGENPTPPDFTTEILGVGGQISEVPGYYVDSMSLASNGGPIGFNKVPVIVLNLPDPRNPNQTLPGIIGTNLFTGRDLTLNIDTQATGQTGLYVSPLWAWKFNGSGNWSDAAKWNLVLPDGVDTQANFFSAITAAQTVTVDGNRSVGSLTFDNANRYTLNGPGTVTLDVSTGDAEIKVNKGSHTINAPVTLADNTQISVADAASVLTINGALTATGIGITKLGAGALEVKHVRAASLDVNGGKLTVLPNGGSASVSNVGALTIAAAGRLDLKDNDIVVRNGTLGTWDGTAYTGIAGLVDAGRGQAATWDGNGIVTSDTRAAGSNDLTSLGVATAGQVRNLTGTATTAWNGQAVDSDDVLVMFTWGGDANLDGTINIDDYGRIDANVTKSGTVFGWSNGDFNYDGKINIDDYGIIDGNITRQTGTLGSASAVLDSVGVVPEPSAAVACLAAAIPMLRRRRGG